MVITLVWVNYRGIGLNGIERGQMPRAATNTRAIDDSPAYRWIDGWRKGEFEIPVRSIFQS